MAWPDDEIRVTYPCHLVVLKSSILTTGEKRGQLVAPTFVALTNEAGHLAIPVFTSLDVAKQFRADAKWTAGDTVIIRAADRSFLGDMLTRAASHGVSFAVFDPPAVTGWKWREWPIDDVIKLVQSDQGQA